MKKIIALIIVISSCMDIAAQNVGIGTTTPGFPLNFANTIGDKISLYGNTGNHYGFGIQNGLLQIHTDAAAANIAFGWGSSTAFTERMRVINSGADALDLKGRITMRNGTFPVDINYAPGIWMYKADNSGLLGFIGVHNNQNLGFYGGPLGWGFTYDAINSSVGIGNTNPNASAQLDVASTTKGFLPPRMTSVQMAAITPAEGLMIYNTTSKKPSFYNGTEWQNFDGSFAYAIGDNFRGGILAYILQPGDPGYIAGQTHGLIAAASDQSAQWGCEGTYIAGATGTALGTGNQNTIAIMAGCATAGIAARLCGDLVLNGYSDWYLPSKAELNLLCINRVAIGGFITNYYWSSSEFGGTTAWSLHFPSCTELNGRLKSFNHQVRAVRAF